MVSAQAVSSKLDKAGGTMTGPLILNADPVAALGAATRQFVLAHSGGSNPATTVTDGTSYGETAAIGTDATFAREDHGHGTPPLTSPAAAMLGLAAEPFPIHLVNNTDLGASAGFGLVSLIRPGKRTLGDLGFWLGTPGSSPTGVNAMALYSEAGAQLGRTGDMTAAMTGSAANSFVQGALSASVATAEGASYYVALLSNMSTPPKIGGILWSPAIQLPPVNGHYPTLLLPSISDLPASFTPSAASLSNAAYWLTAG